MSYNEWLEIEVKRLNDENANISHFFSYDELDFLNEIKELKKRISKLISENTRLQNDLFTEQLKEDETDDYIEKLKSHINYQNNGKLNYLLENNKLKNELFQIYINKTN